MDIVRRSSATFLGWGCHFFSTTAPCTVPSVSARRLFCSKGTRTSVTFQWRTNKTRVTVFYRVNLEKVSLARMYKQYVLSLLMQLVLARQCFTFPHARQRCCKIFLSFVGGFINVMLLIYVLGSIGKCKRKHANSGCGFIRPFRVMSKRIHLEKYGKSGFVSYILYSIAIRKLQFNMICKIKPGTQLTPLANCRLRLRRSSHSSEADGARKRL